MSTEEQDICPHCKGSGHIPKRVASAFPIGTKVWWNASGYGYKDRVPAVVVAHSESGKTCRLRYTAKSYYNNDTYESVSTVHPRMMSMRDE